MEKLYLILIEVAAFLLLALLYYTIQKRRILKHDLNDVFTDLYEILQSKKQEIRISEFEELMDNREVEKLIAKIQETQFSSEEQDIIDLLIPRLQFHLK